MKKLNMKTVKYISVVDLIYIKDNLDRIYWALPVEERIAIDSQIQEEIDSRLLIDEIPEGYKIDYNSTSFPSTI